MRRERAQKAEAREAEEAVLSGSPGKVHGDCDAGKATVLHAYLGFSSDPVLEAGA